MEYRNLSRHLREKYGTRVGKICIDGGFTCPNRDGKVGFGGCIFCGERGAGEHIDGGISIREQVEKRLSRATEGERFIAYFQNFTNTYAPTNVLRERYGSALIDSRIVALAIGTRPDEVTDEVVELLKEYKSHTDIWVELGLQTASDRTAELINRGYRTERFVRAVDMLHFAGIPVVAHVMIGLPGEGRGEVMETVALLREVGVEGVKLHSVYVMEGTRLEQMYRRGEDRPIEMEEYVTLAADCIARLPESVVIHRITGDCPARALVAPLWSADKNAVIEAIRASLRTRGLSQGSMIVSEG